MRAASRPGPYHGAHEFSGTPRGGGAGTRMRPIPRGLLRIQALPPWILRSDWEVDLRAQGHTSAGWWRAGNPDSPVTRQASALLCGVVVAGPASPPAWATDRFAWGRPGECRVTSDALEVILSNGAGWLESGWLLANLSSSSCCRHPPSYGKETKALGRAGLGSGGRSGFPQGCEAVGRVRSLEVWIATQEGSDMTGPPLVSILCVL